MPRPSRRARAARMHPADRRAQLLACALRVFARRGIGATRHADVAAEARVSLPAVFVYFPTRAHLVDAVLDQVEGYYLGMLRDARRAERTPRDILRQIARAFAASVDTHPEHARIWLNWSTAMRDELWPRYLRFQRRALRVLVTTIARGQAERTIAPSVVAEDAAQLMYAAAYAVLQMKLARRAPARVERFLESVVAAVAPAGR